jgi:alpha-glucosidase
MGRDMVDGMNMLALLLPGTAITYYGEEIGMEDTFISMEQTVDPVGVNAGRHKYLNRSRDPERTPFQWDDTPYAGTDNVTHFLFSFCESLKLIISHSA